MINIEKNLVEWLKAFPVEVVTEMMHYQKLQGNLPNIKIFQELPSRGIILGGFSWERTSEGSDFWSSVIIDCSFPTFFKRFGIPIEDMITNNDISNSKGKYYKSYNRSIHTIIHTIIISIDNITIRHYSQYSTIVLEYSQVLITNDASSKSKSITKEGFSEVLSIEDFKKFPTFGGLRFHEISKKEANHIYINALKSTLL